MTPPLPPRLNEMSDKPTNGALATDLVRGSAWMIAARWSMRLIGLVSTVILARLLTPEDFGVVAIALIIVGLLETIAYVGVDLALLRPGHDTRENYDTAWTIQLIQGAIISCALLAIAPWIGPFFSEPRATLVVQVIALRPLISGLQNIGIVAFRKELDFAKDFRFSLYIKLANFFVIVGAALLLRNYWALVIGMISSTLIEIVLSYIMHPFRPKLSLARKSELWGFSQWLIISRAGAYLTRKVDEFVVGRLLGTSAMGGYHVASELATMPTTELVMPLRRAMFPTLSKAAQDPANLERLFLLSFSAVAAVSFSVGFGLSSIATELVPIVLGAKWTSAIVPMTWLAIFGAFSALILALEMLLWVAGKTRASAAQTWLELSLLLPTVYIAAQASGIQGAAIARLAVSITVVPVMIYFASNACKIQQSRLYGAIWRPLLAGLVMTLMLHIIAASQIEPGLLMLVAKVAAGIVIYPCVLIMLWMLVGRPSGLEADLLSTGKKLLQR